MRRNNLVKNVTIGFVFAAITLTGVGTAASALTGSRAVASGCDPLADPVYQGNANKGGGEGRGETKATPDADYSKSLLNPEMVTPATPAATETVVSTDQRIMNYGGIDGTVNSFGAGNEIVSK